MIPPPMIAEHLCNKQPYSIRYRLLKDQGFMSKYDMKPAVGITIAGKIHLNQLILMQAIKRLFEKRELINIPDVDGNKHFLRLDQNHINFESASKEIIARIDDFYILSPDREERVKKVNEIIAAIGPMSRDFSKLIAEAEKGALSYEQIDDLLHEFHTGVAALQDRTRQAFDKKQAIIENLVPSSLDYYDYFCGPDPGGADPEEYLSSTLPNYRKELIKRNFVEGLDVCLQSALRDDLMPGAWIGSYSDEEVWNGLQACDPFRDPFALLGALDVALWRQTDERFKAFADGAVKTLVEDNFFREDGIDVYELMPSLAGLVLKRINVLEGGVLRPPYWKRMCAWMQAGFVIRQTQGLKLDLESLKGWISANMTQTDNFINLLDLRREPMFQAMEMSQSSFRREVLGRLHVVRDRHKKEGRDIPKSDDIDSAISKLGKISLPLCWALPGPLEGHIRPVDKGVKISEEAVKELSDGLISDKAEIFLSSLAYFSQIYDLGENLLTKIREVITNSDFNNEFNGFPELLERIIDSGFIACAHQDVKLSRAIGDKIVSASTWVNSEFTVGNIIQALLVAGSGFTEESDWLQWLESQFTEVAYRLPVGDNMKEFLSYIRELKKILSLKTGVLAKAEAIASAAI